MNDAQQEQLYVEYHIIGVVIIIISELTEFLEFHYALD